MNAFGPMMDVPEFLAHSVGPDGRPQPLVDHLRNVAALSASRAAKFGASDLGRWLGLWHDIGKFNPAFQAYIRGEGGQRGPDHSSAGTVLAAEMFDPLAFPIAGHHSGLPARSALRISIAEKRKEETVRRAIETAEGLIADLRPPTSPAGPPFLANASLLNAELFIRMLFSALVDADYLDTERHFIPQRAELRVRQFNLSLLLEALVADEARLVANTVSSQVNNARQAIYKQCVAKAILPRGVFSLTAPTGAGKTRSGMAFALRHAIEHNLARIIVVIPYTSIIEQNADVYRGIFGEKAVLEHHSGIDPSQETDGAQPNWALLASENWDAPIIVTTTVQLFESLFADRPSRCRRLHNLAHSVIILDEAQTLPTRLLTPILDILLDLVEHYRVSVLLSTATKPALQQSPYIAGFPEIRELVDDPAYYFQMLRRVEYERPVEAWDWKRVADEMSGAHQAMAILNTKRDALALLDALGDTNTLHLSTLLCGAHRRAVLHEVRSRLRNGNPCKLVATQVVEAGVDLDFPLVLRAVGPLDRIIQAAGRCNREGRLRAGRVVVFDAKEGGIPRGEYRTGTDTASGLFREEAFSFDDPVWHARYFHLLYQARDLDGEGIQPLRESLNYPEVAKRFRLIEDNGVPTIVRYRGLAGSDLTVDSLLKALHSSAEAPRWLFRKLQPYLVQVWQRQVPGYERAGKMAQVMSGLWEWLGSYDLVRGLTGGPADPDELVV